DASQVMGGTVLDPLDRLQGHFALMRHPAPRKALFLGLGTGATLAAAAGHQQIEAEGVEQLGEVIALLPAFPETTEDLFRAGRRIEITQADPRLRIRTGTERYDVILADIHHPAREGVGMLYTVEHFEAIRQRLDDDGLFVQWLPLHQLDLPTLKLIIRSFMEVFPDARLSMGNLDPTTPVLALEGWVQKRPPRLSDLIDRTISSELARELGEIGLDTPFALFGGFLAGPVALADFAGEGPLNTDDHPRVVFEAARSVYAPLDPAIDRLLTLVRSFAPKAVDALNFVGTPDPIGLAVRFERYWQARNAFLGLSTRIGVTGDPAVDARQLAPVLVQIVAQSPDFTPAYLPAVAIARAVAPSDPVLATQILSDLVQLAPEQAEAGVVLRELQARQQGQ
ncbi:MAG: spermidine synthase, partial [Pseudomonadota bacterium]